ELLMAIYTSSQAVLLDAVYDGVELLMIFVSLSLVPLLYKAAGGDTVVAHLDKSHVTVHTYPEYHPDTCLATFRVDIDVATCG
ncbi:S-adenosylmethionine decarboxylase, partial [Streptococcus salivarius]|uniref:S-adenosylmethionine decarboxylase n=1 Tax=Streptococcus salivarius TaxID=1304 RepID=UPI001D08224F